MLLNLKQSNDVDRVLVTQVNILSEDNERYLRFVGRLARALYARAKGGAEADKNGDWHRYYDGYPPGPVSRRTHARPGRKSVSGLGHRLFPYAAQSISMPPYVRPAMPWTGACVYAPNAGSLPSL